MENKMEEKKVLVKLHNLKQWFPVKKTKFRQKQQYVRANDGIFLEIYEGETLGLVGESGCGKSTMGRSLLQLYTQTAGKTMYYGRSIDELSPQYVVSLLKNITKEMKNLQELEGERDKLFAEIDNFTGDEKHEKRNEYREARRKAQVKFSDISTILGGFMVLEDVETPCAMLQTAYKTASEMYLLEQEMNEIQIVIDKKLGQIEKQKEEGKDASSLTSQVEKLKTKRDNHLNREGELAIVLRKEVKALEDLRAKNKDNEKFVEYETYREDGVDLAKLNYNEMRSLRKDLQLIFQDPYSSLNPRMTVGQIIGEGLVAHKFFAPNDDRMQDYIMEIMEKCGLAPYMIHRYPHQFSGGQRQRIGIARSLAMKPKFVVCDEAVSALDVSIQSQIINLLQDLKEEENLTYLFISHDLSVVKYISDRIGVMYLGNIVELATAESMFQQPLHPYTEALLLAIPTTDVDGKKDVPLLEGDIPSPVNPPKGCKFHTRCRYVTDECKIDEPDFQEMKPGHFVACHHPLLDKKLEI
ncbi:MAG: oligopeptide/dipeptide ABC transporter ATP-binding protein [Eubacteriales bacterium]